MSTIQASIEGLISEFGKNLLNIINAREDRIREILGELGEAAPTRRGRPAKVAWTEGVGPEPIKTKRGKGGRLPRRSAEDIESMANDIVAFVAKKGKEGVRAEAIRAALNIDKREWMRPLQAALDSKKLKKSGEKRATVYTAANGASGGATSGGKKSAPKKAAKKSAKKAPAKKAKAKPAKKAAAKKTAKATKRAAPKKAAAPKTADKHAAEKPNSASTSSSEATA
jgi:hypothetical protein